MRVFSRVAITALAVLVFQSMLAPAPLVAGEAHARPNVLFISIDDLRPELGCYGASHVHSPNIDRLANEGILFRRAYCQFPVCGPSRASVFSGLRPTRKRFVNNSARIEKEVPNITTLPGAFRKAGYHTVSLGKTLHDNDDTAAQSWSEPPLTLNTYKTPRFLEYLNPESHQYTKRHNRPAPFDRRGPVFEAAEVPDNAYMDGETAEIAIGRLRRLQKMDQPFFMALGFIRPHLPLYAPQRYWDLYDEAELAVADNRYRPKNAPPSLRGSSEHLGYHLRGLNPDSDEFHRKMRHSYYACVSYIDKLVGVVLNELQSLGLRDNTIVVVWGDHGWNLGEHNFWAKTNLVHNSTHVPLIISVPGVERSATTDAIVELVDLYPTLCELAGIEQPAHLEGKSLAPLLRLPDRPGRMAAFTKGPRGLAVTTRDFTYTEYANKQRMLYDRRTDPAENENVAGEGEYRDTVRRLGKLLADGPPDVPAIEQTN